MEKRKCESYFGDYKCHVATNVKHSNGYFVCVDKCLKEAVENLNAKGFKTVASCCGHGIINPKITIEGLSDGGVFNTSDSGLNLACVINWVAAEKLPDYDGAYLCYIKAKQECGNVWEIQKVVQNEYNKWVLDCGEVVVAWAELPKPPCL